MFILKTYSLVHVYDPHLQRNTSDSNGFTSTSENTSPYNNLNNESTNLESFGNDGAS